MISANAETSLRMLYRLHENLAFEVSDGFVCFGTARGTGGQY